MIVRIYSISGFNTGDLRYSPLHHGPVWYSGVSAAKNTFLAKLRILSSRLEAFYMSLYQPSTGRVTRERSSNVKGSSRPRAVSTAVWASSNILWLTSLYCVHATTCLSRRRNFGEVSCRYSLSARPGARRTPHSGPQYSTSWFLNTNLSPRYRYGFLLFWKFQTNLSFNHFEIWPVRASRTGWESANEYSQIPNTLHFLLFICPSKVSAVPQLVL